MNYIVQIAELTHKIMMYYNNINKLKYVQLLDQNNIREIRFSMSY